ncbi:hypothetical protein METBIDRAFT_80157 [Metschnikowia bicuspidata var. bicuspidata NRRL YB-4993]|uniref:1,3-beta-glucanosyltransferase n=1 Tax=Metschnikowia bicuspidata var. bicuspidata NRRL YB-4993 TaxID=869754 RepID=A0A1A0GYY9_9ASCO|nr:hypothetical protein METBIDRAFT_80157 [Metschnikowia bicuspidata var. bicuspidata NRRL YB-4993]OBA16989.1 hypothetical protein METBIDRAFT_80157 [Metschnikowia bicuspidata var. bicuspidata NRRL YB-4993]
MTVMLFFTLVLYFPAALASIHPITVVGKSFIDTVTQQPFFIKGVDYQPGGSSGAFQSFDPLSDPQVCARDIALFQKMKLNTIRVYNIDSSLNHDACMTMLAAAGIYLVLDVNSPLPDHHLNRYEPWSTYTKEYLNNVFLVVHQFSTYNNTLAFFAGNEIINDEISASKSPVYVKAVVRDIKQYIRSNSPRIIPVGYSAADDLNYRVPLTRFLECATKDSTEAIDFYGVNSYQWCGEQTFYTSGYSVLVDAYINFSRPVFFSEYGCNTVQPRKFGEMRSLYSEDMNRVFSGGLIYEFTQEPNNYGLVRVLPNKNVQLLPDFHQAKRQFAAAAELKPSTGSRRNLRGKVKVNPSPPKCEANYAKIHTTKILPPCPVLDLIHKGVKSKQGTYVQLTDSLLKSPFKVLDVDGKLNGMYKAEVFANEGEGEIEPCADSDDSMCDTLTHDSPSTSQTLGGDKAEQPNLLDAFLQKVNWIFAYLFDAGST